MQVDLEICDKHNNEEMYSYLQSYLCWRRRNLLGLLISSEVSIFKKNEHTHTHT